MFFKYKCKQTNIVCFRPFYQLYMMSTQNSLCSILRHAPACQRDTHRPVAQAAPYRMDSRWKTGEIWSVKRIFPYYQHRITTQRRSQYAHGNGYISNGKFNSVYNAVSFRVEVNLLLLQNEKNKLRVFIIKTVKWSWIIRKVHIFRSFQHRKIFNQCDCSWSIVIIYI